MSDLIATACYRELGADLRKAREAAGLTEVELADQLGWSTSRVSRSERGYIQLSEIDVIMFLSFCGVYGIHGSDQRAMCHVGVPRPNPWKPVATTGIDKRPVTGPVAVRAPAPKGTGAVALAGDRAHDVKHHGGPDQAVYAYAREDLDTWALDLGRPLPAGVFGENLTTSGLDINNALIGEHWLIGPEVLLEVSEPRIPCGTFQGWMNEPDWLKRFLHRAHPGTYLRVLQPGTIQAGDPITVTHRPTHTVTVALTFRALTLEPDLLPQLRAGRRNRAKPGARTSAQDRERS